QGLHITNQGEIYRLRPEARSRLTSAYMFLYFVGGATGSVLATTVYSSAGWGGVCAVGAAFGAGASVLWLAMRIRPVPSLTVRAGASSVRADPGL
ncbi:MAG TPA: hypothetical protein VGR90_08455, partial [Acidimicrobiales bacterium]|nr:hypothetical protein [Acidimicrobiales bacterium]